VSLLTLCLCSRSTGSPGEVPRARDGPFTAVLQGIHPLSVSGRTSVSKAQMGRDYRAPNRRGKGSAAALFPLRSAENNARLEKRKHPAGTEQDGRTSMPLHRCCGQGRSHARFHERSRLRATLGRLSGQNRSLLIATRAFSRLGQRIPNEMKSPSDSATIRSPGTPRRLSGNCVGPVRLKTRSLSARNSSAGVAAVAWVNGPSRKAEPSSAKLRF
jgi:hypothetical protein